MKTMTILRKETVKIKLLNQFQGGKIWYLKSEQTNQE